MREGEGERQRTRFRARGTGKGGGGELRLAQCPDLARLELRCKLVDLLPAIMQLSIDQRPRLDACLAAGCWVTITDPLRISDSDRRMVIRLSSLAAAGEGEDTDVIPAAPHQ